MFLTSYGAAREVTGSMHLLTTETDRIILDCGMFQGRRKESEEKNRVVPFDPAIIGNIVLSHAHIDHSGRVPMLTSRGFHGRVICTRVTAAAGEYLLLDSAHIQESDANYLNYKTARNFLRQMKSARNRKKAGLKLRDEDIVEIRKRLKGEGHKLNIGAIGKLLEANNLKQIDPLYTIADAERALSFFDGYPYGTPATIGRDMTCTFYDAGHILGSSVCVITAREGDRNYTIMYTGDLGRFGKPILKDPTMDFPEEHRKLDLMIIESTYGNREHDPVVRLKNQLKEVITETVERGGCLIIPAFAYGRTQALLYTIHRIYNEGDTPRVPVYVDSPLASKLTRVFGEHPEVYDRETHRLFLEQGENPFVFKELTFVGAVEQSMALNREEKPHIVISASGMCEAGRILHHLRYKIHNPLNTVLIVGYMAQNTLGRRLEERGLQYEQSGRKGDPPIMKILGKEYPLKARITKISGFSAHGDKQELLKFIEESNLDVKRFAVVHGEEDQSLSFAEHLRHEGYDAVVPRQGETLEI